METTQSRFVRKAHAASPQDLEADLDKLGADLDSDMATFAANDVLSDPELDVKRKSSRTPKKTPKETISKKADENLRRSKKPSKQVPFSTIPLAKYPSSYDMLTRESDHALGTHELIEGFDMTYNRGSNDFSTSHTVSMNEDSPSYQFSTSATAGPVAMFARMSGSGTLFALAHVQANEAMTFKGTAQLGAMGTDEKGMSLEANIADADSHTSVKLIVNPKTVNGTLSYMQGVTDNTALGCELTTNFHGGVNNIAGGARHTFADNIATAQLSYSPVMGPGASMSFTRKVKTPLPNSSVTMSTKLEAATDPRSGTIMTNWVAGGEVAMQQHTYKGQIDASGKMTGIFKQRVTPFMSLTFCAAIDVPQEQYKFGVGLSIDIQDLTSGMVKVLEQEERKAQRATTPPLSGSAHAMMAAAQMGVL